MNEELETSVLDYMLYYVLVRSESPELMQYNLLVDLLDNLIQTQSRAASAQRKNRPESSSPEKLKMRNPQKAAGGSGKQATAEAIKASNSDKAEDDEDDNYSDEEIANDPDDGDDGTNKLMQVKDLAKDGADDDEKYSEVNGDDDDDDEDQGYLEEFEKVQKKAKTNN